MTAHLPQGVFELWAALDGGPPVTHLVRAAVMDALRAKNPRLTFNNKMRGLRVRSARPLHMVRDWLKEPDTQRQASQNGAYWALRKWQSALDRMIDNGEAAHKAFGGDKPGRRAEQGFTPAERAAIYGEYRKRAGVGLVKALDEYSSGVASKANSIIDEREVRRARKRLQLEDLTLSEIRTLATGPAGPTRAKMSSKAKSGV